MCSQMFRRNLGCPGVHLEGPGCTRAVARAVDTIHSTPHHRSRTPDPHRVNFAFARTADSWRMRTLDASTASGSGRACARRLRRSAANRCGRRQRCRPGHSLPSIRHKSLCARRTTTRARVLVPQTQGGHRHHRSCGCARVPGARARLHGGDGRRPLALSALTTGAREPHRPLSAGRTGACGPRRPSSRAARRWRPPCRGRPPAGPRSRRASARRSDSRSPP